MVCTCVIGNIFKQKQVTFLAENTEWQKQPISLKIIFDFIVSMDIASGRIQHLFLSLKKCVLQP